MSKLCEGNVYIADPCFLLGEHEATLEESFHADRLLSRPEALAEAGFARHRYCGPETTSYDLAKGLVGSLESLSSLGGLIYATSLPLNGNLGRYASYRESRDVKYLMDFPASHLQADFGLDGILVLGINQLACTSLLGAIRVAASLVRSEPELESILCLTSDRFPEGALYEQAYNLISDGAAGCVVTRQPRGFRFLGAHAITNGALAFATDDQTIGSYFTYTHRLISELLAKVELELGDIHWIVPQNVNTVTWEVLCSVLRFDSERVLMPTMADVGHVISGDNIINLASLERSSRFAPGDRILLPMAGYGLNWRGLLLEKI